MKRLVLLAVLTMFSSSFLMACNTMAGAGKDVQKVGERSKTRPGLRRMPSADGMV